MLGVASGRYSKEELSQRGADKVIDDFKVNVRKNLLNQ